MKLFSEAYDDIFRTYTNADRDWVARSIRRAPLGDVCDLGCATGRVLQIAEAEQRKAWGIDSSPDMIRVARSRFSNRVDSPHRLIAGDYTEISLPSGIAVYTSLLNTWPMTIDDRRRLDTMKMIKEKLVPGGRFLVAMSNDNPDEIRSYGGQVDSLTFGQIKYEVKWSPQCFDESSGRYVRKSCLQIRSGDSEEEYIFTLAVIDTDEFLENARATGLVLEHLSGDFNGKNLEADSPWRLFEFSV